MFSRLWSRNQIILCAISGGSLEKLTRGNIFARDLLFEISVCWGAFRIFLGVFLVFLRVFRIFGRVFLVFWGDVPVFGGCSGFLGVPWCSGMFRCSGVPCSGVPCFGVPGSTTCRKLQRRIFKYDAVILKNAPDRLLSTVQGAFKGKSLCTRCYKESLDKLYSIVTIIYCRIRQ